MATSTLPMGESGTDLILYLQVAIEIVFFTRNMLRNVHIQAIDQITTSNGVRVQTVDRKSHRMV